MGKINRLKGFSADALMLTFIKVVTTALGMVITRLLSQYLTTREYGTYSQILLIVSTVSSLTVLGMVDGVNYFYCSIRDAERRESHIATLFSLQCVIGSLVGTGVFLARGLLAGGMDNPDMERLMIFAAVLPLMQNLLSMLQILMVSIGKARWIALRNLAISMIRLAAALVVALVVQNVAVFLLTTLALDLIQILLFHWILKRNNCPIRFRDTDFRLSKQILQYCLPMAVFVLLNSLNRDMDKYLIAFATDTETLAVYANASKALPLDIVMSSFCTVLQPELTRLITSREREKAARLYRAFVELSFVATAIPCFAVLAAAPQVMELIYSSKYLSGLNIFCVYIFVDMIRFTNITMILCAAGKTGKLMFLSIGALLGNGLMNLLLFRWIGIIGPAVATLLTTAAVGIIMLRCNAGELKIPVRDLFSGSYLAKFFLAGALVTEIFALLQQWLAGFGLSYFLILILAGGGCGGTLLLLFGKRLLAGFRQINNLTKSDTTLKTTDDSEK